MTRSYDEFLAAKAVIDLPTTQITDFDISDKAFDFQDVIIRWALRRGKSAIFADCGLGKGICLLEWSKNVVSHTNGPVLVLAPLAVSHQLLRESKKFETDAEVKIVRSMDDVCTGINITNYQKLERFDPSAFSGVVCEESSILKSLDGKLRTKIIHDFKDTPFRLACTATPAPNDHMELGNHAEFLGAMTRNEMLAMFFVHDGANTSQWRLKRHAEDAFWKWVASWAVCMRRPSDLGFEDGDFVLPPLKYKKIVIPSSLPKAKTLTEHRAARKESLSARVKACADMVNNSDEPWIVWCDLNFEGDALAAAIPDAVQVAGSDTDEHKTRSLIDFSRGKIRVLVSKSKIAGFGMNWQHCRNQAFVGLSHSYESFYQAVRRSWRFGQTQEVRVHLFLGEAERGVLATIGRKQKDADRLAEGMVKHMQEYTKENIGQIVRDVMEYKEDKAEGRGWKALLGDSVEVLQKLKSDSMHYSIFSPPFSSLYTYSNSSRDLGNCRDNKEFAEHMTFIAQELFRVIKPGRNVSFHCMNLPTSKSRDGFIGLVDFRGQLIRMFQKAGFIYHSEVTIWKDPVVAVTRTKALGLLHKQLKKDSCMSRQGIPDYLVTMRKPGENMHRVQHTNESFPVKKWQQYASPVWMDIKPSDTLQGKSARAEEDERHICPLQKSVIERGLELWSSPGDWVLSPFMGIGSEGYVALQLGRRFIGIELKESYFKQAVANLKSVSLNNE